MRRFDEIQDDLGIARNVLTSRLEKLVAEGVLEKRPYSERPPRFEYVLTEKGLDLWPVVVSLMQWGDRHEAPPEGPPVVLTHRDCGGEVTSHRTCERCGEALGPARCARAKPGPSAPASHPLVAGKRRPPATEAAGFGSHHVVHAPSPDLCGAGRLRSDRRLRRRPVSRG